MSALHGWWQAGAGNTAANFTHCLGEEGLGCEGALQVDCGDASKAAVQNGGKCYQWEAPRCKEGHAQGHNPLCALCADGHVRSGDRCEQCPSKVGCPCAARYGPG